MIYKHLRQPILSNTHWYLLNTQRIFIFINKKLVFFVRTLQNAPTFHTSKRSCILYRRSLGIIHSFYPLKHSINYHDTISCYDNDSNCNNQTINRGRINDSLHSHSCMKAIPCDHPKVPSSWRVGDKSCYTLKLNTNRSLIIDRGAYSQVTATLVIFLGPIKQPLNVIICHLCLWP